MGNQQANQAWVVAIDMGYGHQRAAYPLRHLSPDGTVFIANRYEGIPKRDFAIWHYGQRFYEAVSRAQTWPLIGSLIFGVMDSMQAIDAFQPGAKHTRPTLQLRQNYASIRSGWGKDLVDRLNTKSIPLITTFFTIAFMAEEHGFANEIYVVVCDTDVSRSWAPLNPETSRIKYCAPTERVVERLKSYGVNPENIFLTGFPLPSENVASPTMLERTLATRLHVLNPEHAFGAAHHAIADSVLEKYRGKWDDRPVTVTYAVGGAGAQRQIAYGILKSLKKELLEGKIRLHLVAGVRAEIADYFRTCITKFGLQDVLGTSIFILQEKTKDHYFAAFDKVLQTTDVLWTKPSELVFYSALGLPIVIGPALGSQEDYNQAWLVNNGAGIVQSDPKRTHEWLLEWISSGALAGAAVSAYVHGRRDGVQKIESLVCN